MKTLFPHSARPYLKRLVFLFSAGIAGCALAVAPAKPVNVKVEFTRVGFKETTEDGKKKLVLDNSGNSPTYLIKWESKSVDEEGFRINVTGAVNTSRLADAGSESFMVIGLPGIEKGLKLNFSVSAWKRNGAAIEFATSAVTSFIIPEGTGPGSIAAPSNLNITNDSVTSGAPPTTVVNDGTIVVNWTDNSSAELYNQILIREVQTNPVSFVSLGYFNFTTSGASSQKLSLGLRPSTQYEFQLRATTENPSGSNPVFSNPTFTSNTASVTTPPLTAPSDLSVGVTREDLVLLRWRDNSSNETGYDIQIKTSGGSSTYQSLGQVGRNATSVSVPVSQGSTLEWRVLAIYQYTPSGSNTATTIFSGPSNSVTRSTAFPAPSDVTASASGLASTVNLTWKDNSNSEYGYNIYTRKSGTTDWFFARAVRANVTKVSVNSRTEANDSNGKPLFVELEPGIAHDFVVRGVDSTESNFSVDSNTATATAQHGFTSRLYAPVQAGASFSYNVTTSNASNLTSVQVTGLPSGLNFNNSNNTISGSPSESGVFQAVMTASFLDSPTATATLILRVLAATTQPSVPVAFPNRTLGINGILDIPLAGRFADANSETAVRLTTTKGNIDILLYPSVAPKAVSNFMAYVNAGNYDGLAFHRLVSGFVLQAGSLKALREPRTFTSVVSRGPIENEPGITHVTGTIGAAKIGARSSTATLTNGTKETRDESYGYVGDPDSATTDFFFNLADNSTNLDQQNGGFTAFGRVSTPSLSVIDAIKVLPKGSYLDGNTTNNYNASLDKRIIVDGSLAEFNDIPMDVSSSTAPADMDITKTVRITKAAPIPTLTYSASVATSPTGIVSATLTGSTVRLRGLKEGTTMVTVGAQDLDSTSPQTTTFNVTVTKGHLAVAITKQPKSQSVVSGSTAILSVTATGTAPITYAWRKDGVSIPSQTGPTLTLTNVQASDQGLYDVFVGNATTTLSSNRVRLDIIDAPSISPSLVPLLVEVGKPLTLSTFVDGSPVPTVTWKKGTATIRSVSSLQLDGRVATSYSVPAAKLTDAGDYSVSAKNSALPVNSNTVNVRVVDKTSVTRVVGPNVSVTLAAPFAGTAVSYQWKQDGQNIAEGVNGFTGTNLKDLKITRSVNGDQTTSPFGHSGRYTCMVTLADGLGTVEAGPINLAVVIQPQLPKFLSGNDALPNGFIGVDYLATLPYSKLTLHTPTSFTFAPLPPGLKLNTLTGVISGKPTRAGIYPFSATARNIAGSSYPISTGQIIISPLPAATIGTLTAIISASPALNENKGGRLDLTTLDTGAYSARITLGKTTLSAAGALSRGSGLYDPSSTTFQSRINIPRKGLSTLSLTFEIDSGGGYVSGTLNDGTNTVNISGIRQFWDSTWQPCFYVTPTGRPFHLGLDLKTADIAKSNVPQGSGYMTVTVSSKGIATMAGLMADGSTITGSSMVSPVGEALFFQMLYANIGSHLTTIDIGDTDIGPTTESKFRVTGESRWIKDAQPATARNYQTGIPETYLDILGTNYTIPGTGKIVMDLPIITAASTTNANLEFSEGGFSLNSIPPAPNQALLISRTHAITYPSGTNGVAQSFSVVSSTGRFTGSFTLADARRVPYQGLIIPSIPATPARRDENGNITANEIPGSSARGAGYFLMPELLPTLTTSRINSGKVTLLPTPILILTQPAPTTQAVNPGTPVTYSVFVDPAAQGTLTYRWRRNGTSLSSATAATLSLASVSETNQGTYDCVISNGSTTMTSTPAVLNVNDPVTAIVASRTPSGASVATGTSVTFSVTAQGTPNLTYQWRKNTNPISGATNATFTISSVASGDTSTYDVIVSNIASTAGVKSNDVVLTVNP
jgi:cyclophilin family peptidyl-prolyl cis-trans isomerase